MSNFKWILAHEDGSIYGTDSDEVAENAKDVCTVSRYSKLTETDEFDPEDDGE